MLYINLSSEIKIIIVVVLSTTAMIVLSDLIEKNRDAILQKIGISLGIILVILMTCISSEPVAEKPDFTKLTYIGNERVVIQRTSLPLLYHLNLEDLGKDGSLKYKYPKPTPPYLNADLYMVALEVNEEDNLEILVYSISDEAVIGRGNYLNYETMEISNRSNISGYLIVYKGQKFNFSDFSDTAYFFLLDYDYFDQAGNRLTYIHSVYPTYESLIEDVHTIGRAY